MASRMMKMMILNSSENAWVRTITPTKTDYVVNGNMETGTPPTGWNAGGSSTNTSVADERTGGAGTKSLNNANADGIAGGIGYNVTLGINKLLEVDGWVKCIDVPSVNIRLYGGAYEFISVNTETAWTRFGKTLWDISGHDAIYTENGDAVLNHSVRYDDITVYDINIPSCFGTKRFHTVDGNVNLSAGVTWSRGLIGMIVNLDSYITPLYGVFCYIDGAKVYIQKMVNGVPSSVMAGTDITYVAGQVLKVIKVGTTYQIFYNGSQVGTDQTIADAGIVDNIYHGQFSTNGDNAFASFFLLI